MNFKCPSGNFCLKALEEIRHGLPNKRLSGTSFNFLIWKNESNQTHVPGQTLSTSFDEMSVLAKKSPRDE